MKQLFKRLLWMFFFVCVIIEDAQSMWIETDVGCLRVQMKEFYQPRKTGRVVTVSVVGKQVPLYGAGAGLHSKPNNGRLGLAVVPVRLAFLLRARAHILGLLVRSQFYRPVHCTLAIHEARLGKPGRRVASDCHYHDGR
jgi:hypothetical protein